MNLPAGSAGNIVSVVDYTNTFQTNFLTIAPNGSDKIGGQSASVNLSTEGQSITLVYVDGNEGWKNVQDSTSNVIGNAFIAATGGTITTCGNDTIHTFTGPGTFTVTKTACCAANNEVSYIVVAGGGAGGGGEGSGGGGAGGFREDKSPVTPYTASPLDGAGPITVSVQGYPITVGAGGAFTGPGPGVQAGSNSVFSTIISAGGGYGGNNHEQPGANGGSGGGGTGRNNANGGSGNTPPTSPPQGNNAGNATTSPTNPDRGGGGGGAGAAGSSVGGCAGADGGNGVSTSINGTPTAYAGGGGGGKDNDSPNGSGAGDGGTGGGGNGGSSDGAPRPSTAGTTNTGGGGGGGAKSCNASSSGGSGIVIIRYKSS